MFREVLGICIFVCECCKFCGGVLEMILNFLFRFWVFYFFKLMCMCDMNLGKKKDYLGVGIVLISRGEVVWGRVVGGDLLYICI